MPATDPLARPIFVVAPPRAGARLVARSLSPAGCCTTDGTLLTPVPELDPPDGHYEGRLLSGHCTPTVRQKLRGNLQVRFAAARRHGSLEPTAARLLDGSPRNALRIPFLDVAFPDATFVYVHRKPADALSEALLLWRAGTAITYADLPGWTGPPWSFLLVPGWRELIARPLAEVVTEQWVRTMRVLTDDLERLAPNRWCVVEHDALRRNPQGATGRLAAYLNLGKAAPIPAAGSQQFSSARLSEARTELEPYLDRTNRLAQRAADWLADPDAA